MIAETGRDDVTVTNHGYQAGDTVPATEPGRGPDEIHHLAGNLQVWCGDGPDGAACGPGVSLAARGSVEHPRDHAGDTPAPEPAPAGRVAAASVSAWCATIPRRVP